MKSTYRLTKESKPSQSTCVTGNVRQHLYLQRPWCLTVRSYFSFRYLLRLRRFWPSASASFLDCQIPKLWVGSLATQSVGIWLSKRSNGLRTHPLTPWWLLANKKSWYLIHYQLFGLVACQTKVSVFYYMVMRLNFFGISKKLKVKVKVA